MTSNVAETTTEPRIESSLAPLVESYTADGLAFARATRLQEASRVRWAKRTVDAKAMERLRRG